MEASSVRQTCGLARTSALALVLMSSQAIAGPLLTEPTLPQTPATSPDAVPFAERSSVLSVPSEWKVLTVLPTPAVPTLDAFADPQAELPPVIPLPPAVIPGIVMLGITARLCLRKRVSPAAR
jgi:hypothetical protein